MDNEPYNDNCLYCGHAEPLHKSDEDGYGCGDNWCCCECMGPALSSNLDACSCSGYRPMYETSSEAIEELQHRIAVREWNIRERGKTITKLMERIKELEENSNGH